MGGKERPAKRGLSHFASSLGDSKMKTRNRFRIIIIVGTTTLVLVTLATSTAIAVPNDDTSNNGITIAPEDIKSLKVFVVDAQNKPLAGAKVFQNQVHMPPLAPSANKRTAIKNHNYVTDSAGLAILTWPGESVDLRIWVSKTGYVPLHAMWAPELQSDGDQIPHEFQFVMKKGTKIGGIIKDEDGKPVKGAKVEIRNAASSVYTTITNKSVAEPGIRPVPTAWLAEDDSAIVTDSEGKWTATNIPDDAEFQAADKNADRRFFKAPAFSKSPLRLRVKHPDYEPFDDFDGIGSVGTPTLRELRSQSAVVILKKKHTSDAPN
jgi:protocatechuate 3,4-dioxygenase beta subunit